jgi:hypothetical protein
MPGPRSGLLWTGPSLALSDYLRASTAAHYLWARTRIMKRSVAGARRGQGGGGVIGER